jgi:hypothetical protein
MGFLSFKVVGKPVWRNSVTRLRLPGQQGGIMNDEFPKQLFENIYSRLERIHFTLQVIAWILAMGLAIALNAGYRAGVFGWIWS